VQAGDFDEEAFYAAIGSSGARVLLIGRQAMIVLGLPVLSADIDLWCHIDDIEKLNSALEAFDLYPNHTPEEARRRGRYVCENDEHVDVMVARAKATKDGETLAFDDAWSRRQNVKYSDKVSIALPEIEDLILTKRWAMRPKDVQDIQLMEALRRTKT
jgi:hypothetical protein